MVPLWCSKAPANSVETDAKTAFFSIHIENTNEKAERQDAAASLYCIRTKNTKHKQDSSNPNLPAHNYVVIFITSLFIDGSSWELWRRAQSTLCTYLFQWIIYRYDTTCKLISLHSVHTILHNSSISLLIISAVHFFGTHTQKAKSSQSSHKLQLRPGFLQYLLMNVRAGHK